MTAPPELWPIFICYRRVDGSAAASRLHEMLDKWQTEGPDGTTVQLDVYFDQTMPGVADWRRLHGPYLEKARALILVCTPGAKIDEGPGDWVQREIRWWLEHRETAPILIDPLKEGARYVPDSILERWPDIQRITLVEDEWRALSGAALEEKTAALRRQVIGVLLPSGAAVYAQELETERRRSQRLRRALATAVGLLAATAVASGVAYLQQRAAVRNERTAESSLLDAQAAGLFAASRRVDARHQVERARRRDLETRLEMGTGSAPAGAAKEARAAPPPELPGGRMDNLRHELAQLDQEMRRLRAEAAEMRRQGRELLSRADQAWAALEAEGELSEALARSRPEPPHVFSIELINAGPGESILLHYGTPDATRLVMVNGGPRRSYRQFLEPRLRELRRDRFDGRPVPLELVIAGDRDEDKVGGLVAMLQDVAETVEPAERLVDLHGVWAALFAQEVPTSVRGRLWALVNRLGMPLNRPFDHLVMRPDQGLASVSLEGGLEIWVLGPDVERVRDLYTQVSRDAMRREHALEDWPEERFTHVPIVHQAGPLSAPETQSVGDEGCRPSENALRLAGGSHSDQSVVNLASTVLLFRYRGLTFLHTGDSRGDLILEGLGAAGLLDAKGRAHVDMMSLPHLGSDRNVTVDFFDRVRASEYLFSGDGRHGNPEIATVAALITARGCERSRMYFVNRNEPNDVHGAKLDEFFRNERPFNPSYRRIFRSSRRGSVIIDLLDPVHY